MKLSIIIPAYNEERRIGRTLEEYINFFKNKKMSFEILVVINGSIDNTLGVVSTFCEKYREIKYLESPVASKGLAIINGFKKVDGDLISYVDADGSTSAEGLYYLVTQIEDFDGVMGSRWLKESNVVKKQSLIRRIASRGFNLIVRVVLGLKYNDTQCGSKVFKKKLIVDILDDLEPLEWAFDVGLLYQAKIKKYNIKEVPISWEDDPDSTLNIKRVIPKMFISILRIRFK